MDSAGLSRLGPNPPAERCNARSTARPVDLVILPGSIAQWRSSPRRGSGGNSGGVLHLWTARKLARQQTDPVPPYSTRGAMSLRACAARQHAASMLPIGVIPYPLDARAP